MLDQHFTGPAKFTRFVVRSLLPYIKYYDEVENNNYFRINILLGKRLSYLKSRLDHNPSNYSLAPRYSKAFAYLVPSSKSIFQNNRNEDPALELMRHKVRRYSQASSRRNSKSEVIY